MCTDLELGIPKPTNVNGSVSFYKIKLKKKIFFFSILVT